MIIVGWDGAAGGEDAHELGRLLADRLRVDLLRVSVVVTGASPHARTELERTAGRVVVAPSVARGLSEVAGEVAASAVAVGSSHRGAFGRTLFGTGIEHLAQLLPCPLAVAPRGYARRYAARLERIEVAIDESPEGQAAMGLAERVSDPDRGYVRVHSPGGRAGDAAADGADMLIVGRTSSRARHAHACPLMIV